MHQNRAPALFETLLPRIMRVLRDDEPGLKRPQHAECGQEDEGDPDERMEPIWGTIGHFDQKGAARRKKPDDEDGEGRRAVVHFESPKIEAAMGAGLRLPQMAGIERPAPATRAA